MSKLENYNLLVISDRYPHKKDSITSSFVKSQVDYLRNYFDHVYVIVLTPFVPKFLSNFSFMNPRWKRDAFAQDYNYENVSVYFAKYFTLPFEFFRRLRGDATFKSAYKIILNRNIDFDLMHAHFAYPSGYVGVLLANIYIKPLIVTGHGYDVYALPFKDQQWNEQIRDILIAADRIITPSRSNYNKLMKLGTPTEKISVIPNGYSSTLFRKIPIVDARKKLSLPENKKIILAVGNLESVKGHEYLIKSMSMISDRDILCLIVGSGCLERKLKGLIDNLNLEKCIKLIGAKPHDEIPLWMNACDVFVLPSRSESFGIVQIEAMACGKPVVATRNGGSEEIIINKKLGILVEPKDAEGLARAIQKALDVEWDEEYIRKYADQFTWEKIAKKIVEVYNEVLTK